MTRFFTRSMLVAGIVGVVLFLSLSGAYAQGLGPPVDLVSILNAGNAALCEIPFPNEASATVRIKQGDGTTRLKLTVENSRPHALHTLWLRTGDPVTDATIFSPLTAFGATPMVPTDAIRALVDLTPTNGADGLGFGLQEGDLAAFFIDGVDGDVGGPGGDGFGTRDVANGFYTDGSGDGDFEANLDYELVGGGFPFASADLSDFDIEPEDFEDVGKAFVTFKVNPFAIVLHCFDEKSHGLQARATDALDQAIFLFVP